MALGRRYERTGQRVPRRQYPGLEPRLRANGVRNGRRARRETRWQDRGEGRARGMDTGWGQACIRGERRQARTSASSRTLRAGCVGCKPILRAKKRSAVRSGHAVHVGVVQARWSARGPGAWAGERTMSRGRLAAGHKARARGRVRRDKKKTKCGAGSSFSKPAVSASALERHDATTVPGRIYKEP
jgi:hypothetical protein